MKKLRIGLVGLGRIGKMDASNLVEVGNELRSWGIDLELVLADSVPESAHQAGAELNLRAVGSLQELIEQGIDGLFIATNTGTHREVIRASLTVNVPMFCENPVASNVPNSLEIIREIEAANGIVQIGHQRRFDAGYQEAKRPRRIADRHPAGGAEQLIQHAAVVRVHPEQGAMHQGESLPAANWPDPFPANG